MKNLLSKLKNPRIIAIFVILLLGFLYYIWIKLTGITIPCFYYTLTGFYCPGCGLTRTMVALINLNIPLAFRQNALITCLIPTFIIFFALYNTKKFKVIYHNEKVFNIFMAICLMLVVAFGIVRNLPPFEMLRPI